MTRLVPPLSLLLLTTLACEPVPVTLRLERPVDDVLDPTLVDFADEIRVRVYDAANDRETIGSFGVDAPLSGELQTIPFGDDIEVTAEVLSSIDGSLAGFGRFSGPVAEGDEVVVPLRKLIAYVADRDASGTSGGLDGTAIRALDVGPASDPALDYLPSLWITRDIDRPAGVHVTPDGRHLLVGGDNPDEAGLGLVLIYATTDHELVASVETTSGCAGMTPVGDGSLAVCALADDNAVSIVDVAAGTATDRVLFDDQGGAVTLDAQGIDSAAGSRVVYVVGRVRGNGADVPRVYRVDLDGEVTSADGEAGRAFTDVRVRPDGAEIFVLEYEGGDGGTAFIEVRDASTLRLEARIPLQEDPAKPYQLFRNPNGRHLHVQRDVIYSSATGHGGTEVLDMQTHEWVFDTPSVSIASATGLPDGRVLGGLSHFSNDDGGQLVWIDGPTAIGAKVNLDDYVGHVFAMAASFAERL